jgi:hypothetical protein
MPGGSACARKWNSSATRVSILEFPNYHSHNPLLSCCYHSRDPLHCSFPGQRNLSVHAVDYYSGCALTVHVLFCWCNVKQTFRSSSWSPNKLPLLRCGWWAELVLLGFKFKNQIKKSQLYCPNKIAVLNGQFSFAAYSGTRIKKWGWGMVETERSQ